MKREKRNLNRVNILIVTLALIFSNTLFCIANDSISVKQIDGNPPVELRGDAEDMEELVNKYWLREKDDVFRLANEQDKFILLLVGRMVCPNCQKVTKFLSEDPLLKLISEEYILWHSCRDSSKRRNEVAVYVNQPYVNEPNALPFLHIINPKDPDKIIWGRAGYATVDILTKALTFNLPLKDGLEWHENKDEAFRLARLQNKNVFRFIGRATSNNSVEMFKLLNESPLKETLQENFILWYSRYEDPVSNMQSTVITMSEDDTEGDGDEDNTEGDDKETIQKAPPYLYIINPDEPDVNIDLGSGLQDVDKLKKLIEDIIVTNDIISSSDNNITFVNNKLYISNKIDNELIKIHSITGQLIYSINKKGTDITINASSFPNGILIINSSSGWSGKVLKY